MGLDIYLYLYSDFEESQRKEKEYKKKSEEIWEAAAPGKKYEDLTQEQKDEARAKTKALAAKMGLGEWGEDETLKKRIDLPSKLHPKEDMYRIGYFHSSYNPGGVNHVLDGAIGKTLHDIFTTGRADEFNHGLVMPDWRYARQRCIEVINLWKRHIADTGSVKVEVARPSMFPRPPEDIAQNETMALGFYREERSKHLGSKDSDMFNSYSNRRGEFHFGEPLQLRGIIPGVAKSYFKQGHREQVTYLIYETDVSWYTTALEIVLETIDWVLDHPIPLGHRYVLHWSG